LTPAEAASRYGLSKATIYRWIKVGIVASRKVGMAAVFASVADLDRMMARESVEAK
jgi:excisionase family DNA binding protein